jgi:hypothetical protein
MAITGSFDLTIGTKTLAQVSRKENFLSVPSKKNDDRSNINVPPYNSLTFSEIIRAGHARTLDWKRRRRVIKIKTNNIVTFLVASSNYNFPFVST